MDQLPVDPLVLVVLAVAQKVPVAQVALEDHKVMALAPVQTVLDAEVEVASAVQMALDAAAAAVVAVVAVVVVVVVDMAVDLALPMDDNLLGHTNSN